MFAKLVSAPLKFRKKKARGWIRQGNRARDTGQWDPASDAFRRALQWDPRRADIWIQYAHMLKECGRTEEADEAYARAVALDPQGSDAYLHIGHLRMVQGRALEAAENYEKALSFDPTLEQAAFALEAVEGGYASIRALLSRKGDDRFRFSKPTYKLKRRYSIVSAVYNVEKYLDDFFKSILSQTSGLDDIEIIMVDDGSVDDSAGIIKEWAARYPANIIYVYQDNAGQASARNNGISKARGEWIGFIDPDDFISPGYFSEIDRALDENAASAVDIVCARVTYFRESGSEFSTAHPLDRRFSRGTVCVPVDNSSGHIQMSASVSMFRRSIIIEKNLKFDVRVRPSFEDALFTNSYLLLVMGGSMLFVCEAIYFYRKRADQSSTLDGSWKHLGRFTDQIKYGTYGLIDLAIDRCGCVPVFIQNVILYELSFTLRTIIDDPSSISFLDKGVASAYRVALKGALSRIDSDVLMSFDLAPFPYIYKVGVHSLVHGVNPHRQFAYLSDFDQGTGLLKVRIYSGSRDSVVEILSNNEICVPSFSKTREFPLIGESFVFEKILWIQLSSFGALSARCDDIELIIDFAQVKFGRSIDARKIESLSGALGGKDDDVELGSISSRSWIFMDRDVHADDNAEHLYRYVLNNRPDIECYFVLSKNSPDWGRLESEGFRLIEFESPEHLNGLRVARHVISSHADDYVFGGRFGQSYRGSCRYKFTFLQHGVIQNDLSRWLNRKVIDCFVVSSENEYGSLVNDGPYKYTGREIVLCGLARHDRLRKLSAAKSERLILIMPTWRLEVVGPVIGAGNERAINPNFGKTSYATAWRDLLNSPELKRLADLHDFKVGFFPHANIQPYIAEFSVPGNIEIFSHNPSVTIQDLFARASIVVTDYSSVAFEAAAIERSVLYYQFDRDHLDGGAHIFRSGYFSYEEDGFGPVCHDLAEVVRELETLMARDGRPSDDYLARMLGTFAFRDQNNCERIVGAIEAMDSAPSVERRLPAWIRTGEEASRAHAWALSKAAWLKVHSADPSRVADACLRLAEACRELEQSDEAFEWLLRAKAAGGEASAISIESFAQACGSGESAEAVYRSLTSEQQRAAPPTAYVAAARHSRLAGDWSAAVRWLQRVNDQDDVIVVMARAELASAAGWWAEAEGHWRTVLNTERSPLAGLKLCEALREQGGLEAASNALAALSDHTNLDYLREAILLASAQGRWAVALEHLEEVESLGALTAELYLLRGRALREAGRFTDAREALGMARLTRADLALREEEARLATARYEWARAAVAWEDVAGMHGAEPPAEVWLEHARASAALGLTDMAHASLQAYESLCGSTPDGRAIRLQILAGTKGGEA